MCVFAYQGSEDVVEHADEENGLLCRRDVRHPEIPTEDEVQGPRAPAILLHEKASRLVRANACREAERQVLDLGSASAKGRGTGRFESECNVKVLACQQYSWALDSPGHK